MSPLLRWLLVFALLVIGALLGALALVNTASATSLGTAGVRSPSSSSAPLAEGPHNEFVASGGWVSASNGAHSGGSAVQNTTTTTGDPLTITATGTGTVRVYGVLMTATRSIRYRIGSGSWTPVSYSGVATTYQALVASIPVSSGDVLELERVSGNSVTLDYWTFEADPAPTTTTTAAPTTTTTAAPTTTTTAAPTTTTTVPASGGTGSEYSSDDHYALELTIGALVVGSLGIIAARGPR